MHIYMYIACMLYWQISIHRHPPTLWGGARKKYWGPGPSSFGRQQRLREITIEPVKNGGLGKICGPVPPALA